MYLASGVMAIASTPLSGYGSNIVLTGTLQSKYRNEIYIHNYVVHILIQYLLLERVFVKWRLPIVHRFPLM